MPPVNPPYFQIPMTPAPQPASKKHVKPDRSPLLRLDVRDLSEQGARDFLSCLDCGLVLEEAVNGVLDLLYTSCSTLPSTRSVTLILRSMAGVAYTTGKDLDDDHKEIHFSTDYIAGVSKERKRDELLGVIRHEMVHCWQWNALGTCPGGLVEGVADWVRLRSGLRPPHWKQEWDGDWDAGYQHTAYFLDYLEERFGDGTVIAINERLRDRKYNEEDFWMDCCGSDIETLWKEYGKHMEEQQPKEPEQKGSEVVDPYQEEVAHKTMDGENEKLP